MKAGYAPFGPDGNQVNLHHVLGDEPGPIVELSAATHQRYYKQLHGLIDDGASFRNDPAAARGYDRFRRNYSIRPAYCEGVERRADGVRVGR
ncbi:HNH/ENDO VII family nuclease [Burkholderia diffusa]